MGRNYILFVTKPYSFAILDPIRKAIIDNKYGSAYWYTTLKNPEQYSLKGHRLETSQDVIDLKPDVIFVPGNVIPDFWPGLKVQVFHGIDDEPKGFYRIPGIFDLYCTPGPAMTSRYSDLADKYKHFLVRETGWPKLDSILPINTDNKTLKMELGLSENLPVILYAPTFPPKYTSAKALISEIEKMKDGPYQWILKFHPLLASELREKYDDIDGTHCQIVTGSNILPYMQISNILVTDISSVSYEYLVFDKPIITYRAIAREDKGINIYEAIELQAAIERSLADPEEYANSRKSYLEEIHPYIDGKSSNRILETIEEILKNSAIKNLKKKPKNFVRKWKIKKLFNEN